MSKEYEGQVSVFEVLHCSFEPDIGSRDMSLECSLFGHVPKLATAPQTSKTDSETVIQDPMAIARQAERDLNSHQAKHGVSTADSSKRLPPSPPPLLTQLKSASHRIRRRHKRHRQVPR